MIAIAARAYAALQGRDYVIPDDIQFIATPALRHRIQLSPGAEIEGATTEAVIESVLSEIAAPR